MNIPNNFFDFYWMGCMQIRTPIHRVGNAGRASSDVVNFRSQGWAGLDGFFCYLWRNQHSFIWCLGYTRALLARAWCEGKLCRDCAFCVPLNVRTCEERSFMICWWKRRTQQNHLSPAAATAQLGDGVVSSSPLRATQAKRFKCEAMHLISKYRRSGINCEKHSCIHGW